MNTEIKYFTMPSLSDLFYLLNMAVDQDGENSAIQYKGFEQGFNLATALLLEKDITEFFGEPSELPEKTQDILGHQIFIIALERITPVVKEFKRRYSTREEPALLVDIYNYGYIDGKRSERLHRNHLTASAEK